jgi:hypothetical protein
MIVVTVFRAVFKIIAARHGDCFFPFYNLYTAIFLFLEGGLGWIDGKTTKQYH